ncbi:ATP-binding protein [Treponema sp. OMZ 840]|uniref:ATP-binding protein n=1 Tax=Treponema sp. OMZ 840 TaxID=244313 RepID=UPI003D8FDA0B
MKRELLKTVIYDQRNVIKNFQIVDREYAFNMNANYVLIGLRRAGKSTLLYKIVQDLIATGTDWNQIIYINFEDERLAEFSLEDFNDILSVQAEMSDKRGWFFLDEVQNIDGWEKFARRMADSKEHIFITGSNAKMLSQEIESRLGGRYRTQYVTPYNFREFLTAKNIDFSEKAILGTKDRGKIKRAFKTYFYFGGFPESIQYEDKREYVSSIYQKVLLGDIAARNGIRNTNGLRLLIKKIAESVKDEVSYSKLHNILKTVGVSISKDAVIDYVGYAQQSYLIFAIRNYYSKFVDKETTPKYYFSDNGLLNLFLDKAEARLLENLVAINLRNRYKDKVYYLKSQNLDIDFFVEKTGEVIQAAYSVSDISYNRETKALVQAANSVKKAKKFFIITYDEEKELNIGGIKITVIPVWKWLLKN